MAAAKRYNGFVIGIIVLTVINVSWWQYSEQPSSAQVTVGISQTEPKANSEPMTLKGQPIPVENVDFSVFSKGLQPDPYLPLFGNNFLQARRTSRKILDFSKARKSYQVPPILNTHQFDCPAIIAGDIQEHKRAQDYMKRNLKVPIQEDTYMAMLQNCEKFKRDRGYITVPLTSEEEDYPLAFSISVDYRIEQVERLLRAIYHPQNLYCFHVDLKDSLRLHTVVHALASCFENVFIATTLAERVEGATSELLPSINCMVDLMIYHKNKWKYFINLEEREMPLRTNWELVQIAKIFNGANDIGGSKYRVDIKRVNFKWITRYSKSLGDSVHYNTAVLREDPLPFDITFYKGEISGMFSYRMVEYVVHSSMAKGFFDWCDKAGYSSEYFWNTLNYNAQLNAPGGYSGPDDVAHTYSLHQISRAKHWIGLNYVDRICLGQAFKVQETELCIFGLGDVPWLYTRPELAAHRMNLTSQYLAYDCLEESLRNRTILKDKVPFNSKLYHDLPILKYHNGGV